MSSIKNDIYTNKLNIHTANTYFIWGPLISDNWVVFLWHSINKHVNWATAPSDVESTFSLVLGSPPPLVGDRFFHLNRCPLSSQFPGSARSSCHPWAGLLAATSRCTVSNSGWESEENTKSTPGQDPSFSRSHSWLVCGRQPVRNSFQWLYSLDRCQRLRLES